MVRSYLPTFNNYGTLFECKYMHSKETNSLFIGLHIRVKGKEQPLCHFSYKWAPVTSTACPIEWMPLVKCEVTYRHIRCHKLEANDDLPFLMASMNSAPSTEALILINTENSLDIDPKFLPVKDRSVFPVLVVTAETGKSIMDALSKSEIEVKADLPGQSDSAEATTSKGLLKSGVVVCVCVCKYSM